MTVKTFVPVVALAALAACNSKPEVDMKDAKPSEVASAVVAAGGGDGFIRAGKWRTTMTMEAMEMPGMPPQVAEQMKKAMNRTTTSESCLSEADVKKPKADFFAGANKDCTYDHFTMAGGTIDAKFTCKGEGAAMTMTMAGTYSADHYSARNTMTSSASGMPGGKGMTMTASIDASRVGDCAKS